MKEFATRHPWMAFFLLWGMIDGAVDIVKAVMGRKADVNTEKEEADNESAGDIQ